MRGGVHVSECVCVCVCVYTAAVLYLVYTILLHYKNHIVTRGSKDHTPRAPEAF